MTQHTYVAPAWQHIAQSANAVVDATRIHKVIIDQAKAEAHRRPRDTLLSLIKTAPNRKGHKVMKLPLPFLKIVESITDDLPDDESQTFTAAINAAAKGKDVSRVHWEFLATELRALPNDLPESVQAVIYEVIAGMDRLTAGKEWPEVAKVAEIASNKAYEATLSRNYAAGYAGYAATFAAKVAARSEEAAIYAAAAVTNLLYAAAYTAGIKDYTKAGAKARQRQRDTLLLLINNAS